MELILNSRTFLKVEWVEYENGFLYWGEVPPLERQNINLQNLQWKTQSMKLYAVGRTVPWWFRLGCTEPRWFKLARWKSPRVYVLEENLGRRHLQILLYNEMLSEAYFIERRFAH
jgi:hypothetical protein